MALRSKWDFVLDCFKNESDTKPQTKKGYPTQHAAFLDKQRLLAIGEFKRIDAYKLDISGEFWDPF